MKKAKHLGASPSFLLSVLTSGLRCDTMLCVKIFSEVLYVREEIIRAVERERIIVILRGVAQEKLIPLAEAMYEGGIRLLEVTYDARGITPDVETAKSIERLSHHFEGKMHIGAGTVLTEEQVAMTHAAGGAFIISPDAYCAVIEKTRALGMVSMPGALTPTEIQAAHRFGADFVKIFPVTGLGAEYVKAIRAPLSHIKLLAVGGVSLENMTDYLKAGVSGFGLGSNIVDKKLLAASDFDGIKRLAESYTSLVRG